MKTVILAGGLGTRLREETQFLPKPMVPIGNKPILWHIMKNYSFYNFVDYVICTGYKSEIIKDYFLNYKSKNIDFTLNLGNSDSMIFHEEIAESNWSITCTETGLLTNTGGRLFKAKKYLFEDRFFCTYGDGLSNINIRQLLDFHKSHGKVATMTVVRPTSRYGVVDISSTSQVEKFREKPQADGWINGGFFVFEKNIFDYLNMDSVLEGSPLINLAAEGELMAFKHLGFWQSMDTFREMTYLNDLWDKDQAEWKIW